MMRGKYTIADVAHAAGVNVWTIRRLEQHGRIPDASRDGLSGRRVYDDRQMQAIVETVKQLGKTA